MIVLYKNSDKFTPYTNDRKNIFSILSYDTYDSSQLNSLYYNPKTKSFEKVSYFLKIFNNVFSLRDVIYSKINCKHAYVTEIKSSFLDKPVGSKFNKSDNMIHQILLNFNDINLQSNNKFSINEIKHNQINKFKFIKDNYDFLNHYDYIVEKSDLIEEENFIFETLFLLFTLPLIQIPIYLNGVFDWNYGKFQIANIKILTDDIELKEYLKLFIYKINSIIEFLNPYIKEIIYKYKKSYTFMVNINYFETNLQIYDKYFHQYYDLIFNSNDYYRLLRIFASNLIHNTLSEYNLLTKLAYKNNISTLYDSFLLMDSLEYVLDYYNIRENNERREYSNNFI